MSLERRSESKYVINLVPTSYPMQRHLELWFYLFQYFENPFSSSRNNFWLATINWYNKAFQMLATDCRLIASKFFQEKWVTKHVPSI